LLCSFRCSSPKIHPECWLAACLGHCTRCPQCLYPSPAATVQGVCPLVLSCGPRCLYPGPASIVQGVCTLVLQPWSKVFVPWSSAVVQGVCPLVLQPWSKVSVPWSSAVVQSVSPLVLSCGPSGQSLGPQLWSKWSVPLCCCTHESLGRLTVDLQMVISPGLGGSLRKVVHAFRRHAQCCRAALSHLPLLLCLGLGPAVGAEGRDLSQSQDFARMSVRLLPPSPLPTSQTANREKEESYKRKFLISQRLITQNISASNRPIFCDICQTRGRVPPLITQSHMAPAEGRAQ